MVVALLFVLSIVICFGLAAFFSDRNDKKIAVAAPNTKEALQAHFLAIKAKIVACYLLLTPLLLVLFVILQLKINSYFMVGFIFLWSFAKNVAQSKAEAKSGYSVPAK